MRFIYRAKDFGVIQSIYEKNDIIYILNYLGKSYKYDDVTDDGEVFDEKTGWNKLFFCEKDLALIRQIQLVK